MTIKAPYLYKIKCNTCNSFICKEGLIPDWSCPNGEVHEVEPGYIAVFDDTEKQLECQVDYKKHRKNLIERVTVSGSEMSEIELMYASAHFCTPKEIRDQFFTVEEQIELGKVFHRRSTESRKLRWNKGLVEMFNHISLQDSFEVGMEIELLAFRYLNYGIEGTSEGDGEGIFDYFAATSGTSYETTGFPTKDFTISVSGVTMQDLSTKLLNVLKGISQ